MKLFLFFAPLLLLLNFNLIIDPSFIFHKHWPPTPKYTHNFSPQTIGLIRTEMNDHDSMILGSSTAGNIFYEDVKLLGMNKPIKIVKYGMTLVEGYELAKMALKKNKRIKKILWVLNEFALHDDYHDKDPVPQYLINPGISSYLRYLSSLNTLETSLAKLGLSKKYTLFDNLELSSYTSEIEDVKERWRIFLLSSPPELASYIKNPSRKGNYSRELAYFPPTKLDSKVSKLISDNPQVEFIFLFNAKANLSDAFFLRTNTTTYFHSMMFRFFSSLIDLENVRFFFPNFDDEFSKLSNFIDLQHPSPSLVKKIMERIGKGKYQIKTRKEFKEYFDAVILNAEKEQDVSEIINYINNQ